MFKRLIILGLSLFLVACGIQRRPQSYRLVPPSTAKGQNCLKHCHTVKMMCYKMCHSADPSCIERAQSQAKQRFEQYAKDTSQTPKTWHDFYHPNVCKDKACGCQTDYQACFQMCGGQLIPIHN
jgi:hypothetical protein